MYSLDHTNTHTHSRFIDVHYRYRLRDIGLFCQHSKACFNLKKQKKNFLFLVFPKANKPVMYPVSVADNFNTGGVDGNLNETKKTVAHSFALYFFLKKDQKIAKIDL